MGSRKMSALQSKLLILFAGTILMSGCIEKEDLYLLSDRIDVLEQRIDKQNERLLSEEKRNSQFASQLAEISQTEDKKDQTLRGQSAELHATLEQIREDILRLRGRIEETEYLLGKRQKGVEESEDDRLGRMDKLEKLSLQNKDRVNRVEQYLNLESSKKTGKKEAVAGTIPKAPSQSELYKAAKQSFDSGDFDTARDKFQAFLTRYPKSANADNSQFWIGETYYREKWYEKAILEYQKVIENYPKGNKVQASLLKQGLSFLNLGDKANSRLILKELVSKYPKSNEARIASQKLKEIK